MGYGLISGGSGAPDLVVVVSLRLLKFVGISGDTGGTNRHKMKFMGNRELFRWGRSS